MLETDHGDFDCLGTVDTDKSFDDLLPLSRLLAFEQAEIKDLALLPVLEATLDERNRAS